jgi:hypothetical protein
MQRILATLWDGATNIGASGGGMLKNDNHRRTTSQIRYGAPIIAAKRPSGSS